MNKPSRQHRHHVRLLRQERPPSLAVAWLNMHGMRFEQVRIDIVGLIWNGYSIEHLREVDGTRTH